MAHLCLIPILSPSTWSEYLTAPSWSGPPSGHRQLEVTVSVFPSGCMLHKTPAHPGLETWLVWKHRLLSSWSGLSSSAENDNEALLEKRLCRFNHCDRIFKDLFLAQFSSLSLNALDRMGLFFVMFSEDIIPVPLCWSSTDHTAIRPSEWISDEDLFLNICLHFRHSRVL